ncbi:hypothetical protein [Flavobacterium sp. UBA7663]|uniref:hypothetical protein n=1 Tax=Flavobacterium sp. UBA7663 TaxID=1946557 RepID=UPI0025C39AEB|nr:hypothetical protein [Flavobacterium sp. UBA7663]
MTDSELTEFWDNILKYLRDINGHDTGINIFLQIKKPECANNVNMLSAIDRLIEDKHITRAKTPDSSGWDGHYTYVYAISGSGTFFINNGGYERLRKEHHTIYPQTNAPSVNDNKDNWTKSRTWHVIIGVSVAILGGLLLTGIIHIIKALTKLP